MGARFFYALQTEEWNMKQKILVMLLAAAMALSCAFSFAACTETPTADSDPVVTPGDD